MPYTQGARVTKKAAADLSALRYTAVKLDSNGNAVAATAVTDQILGFLQNAPVTNDSAEVYLRTGGGTCKAKAGAAYAVGAKLVIDSSGRVTTTGNATAGNEIVAIAQEAAGAANQICEVQPVNDRV